jgi:ankyrin repeat protein
MKYCITVFLIAVSITISGQDLFKLILTNDYKNVKEYHGAVNLRDSNQATPLMWAAYSSNLKMVKLLSRKGADATLKGWIYVRDTVNYQDLIYGSCLVIAAGEGNIRMTKYFLQNHSIPVDDREINLTGYQENGWTALHWASVKGNIRTAKILLKRGANINAISEYDIDKTPLLFSLSYNQIQMAKLLIRKGADVNKADNNGLAPLSYALENQNRELIRYLIKHGAILEEYAKKPPEEMLMELFGVKDIEDI